MKGDFINNFIVLEYFYLMYSCIYTPSTMSEGNTFYSSGFILELN